MQYHLNIAGENSGPHSQFAIIDRIRDGVLPQDALIWRQGLEGWKPAGEVEELSPYWPKEGGEVVEEINEGAEAKAAPESLPAKVALPNELSLEPRPWVRFWARVLDYLFFVGLVFLVLTFTWPTESFEWIVWASNRSLPLDTLLMLSYVPLEAWFLSRFGKTPGRLLLRLEVVRDNGDGRLTFKQALVRSVQVYVKGMALWLPLVSLLTMSFARLHLLRNGRTSWDLDCGTVVTSRPMEAWRIAILGGVTLTFLLLIGIGMSMQPQLMEMMKQAQGK